MMEPAFWEPKLLYDCAIASGVFKGSKEDFYLALIKMFGHDSDFCPRLTAEWNWIGTTMDVTHRDIQVLQAVADDLETAGVEHMNRPIWFRFPTQPTWAPRGLGVRTALFSTGFNMAGTEPMAFVFVDVGQLDGARCPELIHLNISRRKGVTLGNAIAETEELLRCKMTPEETDTPCDVMRVIMGKLLIHEKTAQQGGSCPAGPSPDRAAGKE